EEIKQILALVREHELAEFELEHQDFKIRIRKEGGATVLATPPPAPAAAPAPAPVDAAPAPAPTSPLADSGDEEVELAVVKAPIVGTFYQAPEPGAPPFVKVGDIVRKNQVLCIIEA